MYLKLILSRLENEYYLNESSLKFDIDLLANNARQFNSEEAPITKDAEVLRERFFKRIDQLSSKFKENNQVISNGTNIKINLNSDSGGSGIESMKKLSGKKRKRGWFNKLDIGRIKAMCIGFPTRSTKEK